MNDSAPVLETRVDRLERSLRRTRIAAAGGILVLAVLVAFGLARRPAGILDEVRTRQLSVVDDEGRVRVEIAQDPPDTDRRARSAGLRIFDNTGHERGGFATFDDGSVTLGLDAPHGVGNPMPDRLSLAVDPDGAADVMLLDNQTRAVAKLVSDGRGGGGVQLFQWDMEAGQIHVRTLTFVGDQRETVPFSATQ